MNLYKAVWLTSYGGYHKLDIPVGNPTKIAHGLFLATNDLNNYTCQDQVC